MILNIHEDSGVLWRLCVHFCVCVCVCVCLPPADTGCWQQPTIMKMNGVIPRRSLLISLCLAPTYKASFFYMQISHHSICRYPIIPYADVPHSHAQMAPTSPYAPLPPPHSMRTFIPALSGCLIIFISEASPGLTHLNHPPTPNPDNSVSTLIWLEQSLSLANQTDD